LKTKAITSNGQHSEPKRTACKFEKFQLNNQGISSQSIDVANLPKGVYIVSLNIEGNLTTRNVYID
jgi:hypothetical protein